MLGVHEPTRIRLLIVCKITAVVGNIHNYKTDTVLLQRQKSGEWQRKSSCTDIQLSEQMGVRTVMASNFPQSYGGFLSELPGAVFTESIAWQHIPNSIRTRGQGSSGEVSVGSGGTEAI